MKRSVLFSLFVMAITLVVAQNVPREMVALEIGTGTWCQYCPGAAMGADDLLENGCKVAVAENHNGDAFTNQYSNARNAYYSISGYPTAKFDGILTKVGGSQTSSMYSSYLPLYNNRMGVPALIDMNMTVSNTGLAYTVVVNMEKVGSLPTNSFKLRFYVTLSHIQYNWFGQNHLNFVNVLMVPDATGTTVDFTGGDIQTVILNFNMDAAWPLEDCEFIAFLQNDSGKEIMQTIKRAVIDLNVGFSASATQIERLTPVTFTNNTSGGYIGVPETYKWFFPGAEPDYTTLENPTTTYTQCGIFDVTLIVDRGGQIDTLVKEDYVEVTPHVGIPTAPGGFLSFTVYPNPSAGKFTLDISTGNNTRIDLKLVNALNTTAYEENGISVNTRLLKSMDLSLASGIYYVVIRDGNQKAVKKIVLTR
jgi:hypothetical protein